MNRCRLFEGLGLKTMQTFQVRTSARTEFIDITRAIREAVKKTGVDNGICIIFIPHTTAAVTVNENADPSVVEDMIMALNKIVPFKDSYRHGEGNSPSHIKASLVGCSQTVFVDSGELVLGTWQGIFFCEFDGPRNRKVHVKVISEE
ncbi:MAG TPA: secondary thiamine-phosphate synthase enzyme YjbQ [Thermodesulfobacteriota bacterium]|nr:secondary thiamine-phosphate synthase enzyme YjbQ [Thermodesulfobacteriota bacterium]